MLVHLVYHQDQEKIVSGLLRVGEVQEQFGVQQRQRQPRARVRLRHPDREGEERGQRGTGGDGRSNQVREVGGRCLSL